MDHLSLTPATQAVLDALTELGQGTAPELADKSGKARSTTDKALKTLADAGLILTVDTDADPADGTPTRWALATPRESADADPNDAGLGNEHTARADKADLADPALGNTADDPDGNNTEQTCQPRNGENQLDEADHSDAPEDGTEDEDVNDDADNGDSDEERTAAAVRPARPGDRKVMAIKGVLADYGDAGATLDLIVAESGIGHATAARLLTAMEQADAARRLPGRPERWIAGPTRASEVDPNPEPPRCPLCSQILRGLAGSSSAVAAVLPLTRPDGTLHIVGPDGDTHVVTLPPRLSTVARNVVGRRGDGGVNADGAQPFGRGELEKLTLDVLAAQPGTAMSPQDIATIIAGRLGRTVSSGAVRNNCTKAAAAGRIVLVSDTPLTFAHPAPAESALDGADAKRTDQPWPTPQSPS